MNTPKKHRGARAELIACQWLLEQGYEVFRNVSACGFADLVAFRDGELFKIDVKSGHSYLPESQIAAGIVALTVSADGTCELIREPKANFIVCQNCSRTFRARHKTQYCGWECKRDARLSAQQHDNHAIA